MNMKHAQINVRVLAFIHAKVSKSAKIKFLLDNLTDLTADYIITCYKHIGIDAWLNELKITSDISKKLLMLVMYNIYEESNPFFLAGLTTMDKCTVLLLRNTSLSAWIDELVASPDHHIVSTHIKNIFNDGDLKEYMITCFNSMLLMLHLIIYKKMLIRIL